MQKSTIKKALSMALFLVLIALLGYYLYRNRDELLALLKLDVPTVAWILLLALGACVANCVYHKLILDTYHMPLQPIDWLGVVFVANVLAFVLPLRADLVFSATYYKRTKGLAYVKSVSVAAGNIIFGVLFALIQMLAALICTGLLEGQWPAVLWLVWGGCTLAVGVFIAFSLFFQDRMPKWLTKYKKIQDIVTGFNDLLRNRALLWKLLACLTVNNLLHLFLFMACFRAIGMNVTIYQALFYNSVNRLCSLVAIVPNNLGIREAVMGASSKLMGDLFQSGVVVSLLHSAALMVVYIVAGGCFAYPVWKRWKAAPALEKTE